LLPERNLDKMEAIRGIELTGVREIGDALDAIFT